MEPVVDLVGDEIVVVVERGPHRQAFDVHGLDREADAEVEDDREHDDLGELAQQRRGGRCCGGGGASRLLLGGRHESYETSLAQTRSSSSRLEYRTSSWPRLRLPVSLIGSPSEDSMSAASARRSVAESGRRTRLGRYVLTQFSAWRTERCRAITTFRPCSCASWDSSAMRARPCPA